MDWSIFINCKDVIEVWSRFSKMMKDLVVKFVPKKMRKTVKKPMWWNRVQCIILRMWSASLKL